MARETRPWDAAETLETKEDIAAYLDAVLEDGDPALLKAALGDVARAKGMTEIALAAGIGRANLYKALSHRGYVLDLGQNRFTGTGRALLDDPRLAELYLG